MPDQTSRESLPIDELWTTGKLLLDTNSDGYVDDVAARIVLDGSPNRELWVALFDLAARLGLETSGLTLPLVTDQPRAGQLPVIVTNGNADLPEYREDGWNGRPAILAQGPRAVQALARAGLAEESAQQPNQGGHWSAYPDLARLLEIDMLLSDEDNDQAPDGTRLGIVVPEVLPDRLGAALIDLCARIGLESGGIDLPVATTGKPIPGRCPLLIELDSTSETASLQLSDSDRGFALRLSGDPDQAAALIAGLAESWPELPGSRTIEEVDLWLRQAMAGWNREGRAARLLAAAGTHQLEEASEGSALRLLIDDPEERQALASLVRERAGASLDILEPDSALTVFDQQWDHPWEGQRIIDALRDRVLPKLDAKEPLRLSVVASEPAPIRTKIADAAREALAEAGFESRLTTITVLDAFKPGLGWIDEVLIPQWQALEGIDRVRIVVRHLAAAEDTQLDLSIRWLQELFPVDEIIARKLGLPLDRIALEASDGDAIYTIEALDAAGGVLAKDSFSPLSRQQPYLEDFPTAGQIQVTTGGIIARQGETEIREPVATDPEAFWHYFQTEVLPRVRSFILEQTDGNPAREQQPFFDELSVEVTISESDEPYGIREERHSAAEALHEDIYFNALDYIETLGVETSGERLSAPGQVVPVVHVQPGTAPRARVRLRARASSVARMEQGDSRRPIGRIAEALGSTPRVSEIRLDDDQLRPCFELDGLSSDEVNILKELAGLLPPQPGKPVLEVRAGDTILRLAAPSPDQLPAGEPSREGPPDDTVLNGENLPPYLARLAELPGVKVRLAGRSFQGRPIPSIDVTAPSEARMQSPRKLSRLKPTFLVVARHHANEVASTTAALWLVERLATDPDWRGLRDRVNVIVIPNENADGTELHRFLMTEHPTWKHHPARYNATGFEFAEDMFNPDTRYGEARVRTELWRRWLPDVVVDNHGVPSHEWAQLFAGFGSPPRFRVSYWQLQALIYGILHYSRETPEHEQAALALREAVTAAIGDDSEIAELNRIYGERYLTWGHRWEPEHFPADFKGGMQWYFGPRPEGQGRPGRRSYTETAPRLTVVNWVTEVGDETALGRQLALTARAHLLANQATLELLSQVATQPVRRRIDLGDGRTRITLGRDRPIQLR